MSLHLAVKVSPGAASDRIQGWLGGALKIPVTAAPERGKANAAVEALPARVLGVPRRAVQVVAGHGASRKRVRVEGLDAVTLRARVEDS